MNKEEKRDFLNKLSVEELSYFLGRYCGPGNIIIAQKDLGWQPDKKMVEEIISQKTFEEAIFDIA